MRMMQRAARDSLELRETDASMWVQQAGLKDARDVKEVQLLVKILNEIGHRNLPRAMDLLARRIREIRVAKTAGGSWEKAQVISLLPSQTASNALIPDASFVH